MVRQLKSSQIGVLIVSAGLAAACASPPEMAKIAPVTYEMGETVNYGYGEIDGPRHTVEIKNGFAFGVTEVTVGQFRKFVQATGYNSSGHCNIYTDDKSWHVDPTRNWEHPGFSQEENHPVVCVSWDDTQAYITWLTTQFGKPYRLPSEAEWEYVATMGGIEGLDGSVDHNEANIGLVECCGGKAEGKDQWLETAPVASFPADSFGLYDIRGNVWEWQADCHQETYNGAPVDGSARKMCQTRDKRSIRGGSYGDAGDYLSPRYRLPGPQSQSYFTVGFRVAHDVL